MRRQVGRCKRSIRSHCHVYLQQLPPISLSRRVQICVWCGCVKEMKRLPVTPSFAHFISRQAVVHLHRLNNSVNDGGQLTGVIKVCGNTTIRQNVLSRRLALKKSSPTRCIRQKKMTNENGQLSTPSASVRLLHRLCDAI